MLTLLEGSIPDFLEVLLNHRPEAWGGATLPEAMGIEEHQPGRLSEYYQSWRGSPVQMGRTPPSLVLAAIGQAKMEGKLAKKQKGSRHRNKLRLKVARVHTKIADCRRDATHKATRTLINENQVVCVESLAVKNLIKHPTLAKPIADAHWGEFVRQLKYKAEWAGRTVVENERGFPSSKRCPTPGCGHLNETLALEVREWVCPWCGSVHDRDIAAAINIKTAGLAGLASGATGTGATTGVVA